MLKSSKNCLVWQCFPWMVSFSNNTTLNDASINLCISRFMLITLLSSILHPYSKPIREGLFSISGHRNCSHFHFFFMIAWTELCFFLSDEQSLFALLLFLLRDFVFQIITFFLIGMWCIFQENWSEGREKHRCSFLFSWLNVRFLFPNSINVPSLFTNRMYS